MNLLHQFIHPGFLYTLRVTLMNKNAPKHIAYYSRPFELAFYILGDADNLRDSNVQVVNRDVSKNDKIMPGGVGDLHMGTTSYENACQTCHNPKVVCPGHFGHISLKYPVKSPLFREELLKWLKVTCKSCGSLLVQPPVHLPPVRRLAEAVKRVKDVKHCPTCRVHHDPVVKDVKRPAVFYIASDDLRHTEYLNNQIKKHVERIDDNSVLLLGKPLRCHPKKFIISSIRCPPNTIRPDMKRTGAQRNSNPDTTTLLKFIVEINENLHDEIPDDPQKIDKEQLNLFFSLDMTYYAMIKGSGGGDIKMLTNMNKPPVAIAEHFPQKQGRIRKNLMGKRVEYMIRSVITGDARLRLDEVGIPISHARNLEIPEIVSEENYDRLATYVANGSHAYPGCRRIIKKSDGLTYRLEHMRDYKLNIGDCVMRDMITGDYVDFNRQPTLRFASIAGMRIVIMHDGETLRMNPASCILFNADFDGDQMACICYQNIQSKSEVIHLSVLSRWFVSLQSHAPFIGAFQDGLIGLVEFTKAGITFNKWHAMQMFADVDQPDIQCAHSTNRLVSYSNRDIFSKFLPDINVSGKAPTMYKEAYAPMFKYAAEDINVKIERGRHISGVIDKAIAGQEVPGSIFHIIANDYGNQKALDVVYQLQQLVFRYLLYHGFTVSVRDINISEDALREIKRRLAALITNSREITTRLNTGKLIAPLGVRLHDFYEAEQQNALNPADDFINPILADIDFETNGIARLIYTGSKGKPLNFISLNAAIGQQTINAKRFPPQAGWGRTSPYFVRYDTEPAANGFISMSYREGIQSEVYSFLAGEARHGMISNALSTSITGYQGRISIKNLETIIIDNLRKSAKAGNVIQPLYADCGYDTSKTEYVKFLGIFASDEEFMSMFDGQQALRASAASSKRGSGKHRRPPRRHLPNNRAAEIIAAAEPHKPQHTNLSEALAAEFERLVADRKEFRKTFLKLEAYNPKEYIFNDGKQLPVNISRLIEQTVNKYREADEALNEEFDPLDAIAQVTELCEDLPYIYMNEHCRQERRKCPAHFITATWLFQIAIRQYLCIANCLRRGLSNWTLSIVCQQIYAQSKRALIDYGTPVGVLAAQCLSEPMTQFVLNSKHRAGGQGGTKTDEIERLKEILGAKDTSGMENPHIMIMLKPEIEHNEAKVQEIANHIEQLNFGRFVMGARVFFEEFGKPVDPKYASEAASIAKFIEHNLGQRIPNDLTKWCIRFDIDKEELIVKSVDLETLVHSLRRQNPKIFVVYTPENAEQVYLRVYLRNVAVRPTTQFYEEHVKPMIATLKNTVIRGIDGILATQVVKVMRHEIVDEANDAGKLKRGDTYGIYCTGNNLAELLAHPLVDPYRTQTDSITEIERLYGISAARSKIINEIAVTMPAASQFHSSVFADEMCYSGCVTSIQRVGLQKREMANVTLRLSFQTPVQVIQEAAINGMVDRITGISGPLIMGTNVQCGTAYNAVVVDREMIKAQSSRMAEALEDL